MLTWTRQMQGADVINAALAFAPFLVAMGLLLMPSGSEQRSVTAYPSSIQWVGGAQDGTAIDPHALVLPEGAGRIAVTFELTQDAVAAGPLGLRLAGLFSATATWNGVLIGAKGEPGTVREAERPGPIDAEIAIPASALRAGINTLELDLSSHASPVASSIIHGAEGLSVLPYSADARRPLHVYLLPLVMIGGLLAALALVVRRPDARWPAAFLCAVLLVAIAEISRAFINYPYPMHTWRTAAQLAGCTLAAFAMAALAAEQAGLRERRPAMICLGLLVAIVAIASPATDTRAACVMGAGALVALMIALPAVMARTSGAAAFTLAIALIGTCALIDARAFLDRSLYAAVLPLIIGFAFARTANVRAPDRLAIGAAKRRRLAPITDIRAIHAADKYAEFELVSGERILDDRPLNEWTARLPENFIRTHRSHIVNVARISAVLVLGPGKYAVEMDDRSRVPLSRTHANRVRAALEGDGLSPASGQG